MIWAYLIKLVRGADIPLYDVNNIHAHGQLQVCFKLQTMTLPVLLNSKFDNDNYFLCKFIHSFANSEGIVPTPPRSWELRTQKLKSHLVRTRSLNVLPVKPGVGQYLAIHDTLTARHFFRVYFYPSGPFTCIFSKTSPDFFVPL